MNKSAFYKDKTLADVEWWLSYCSDYPDLAWARLRLYSDGSADAAFEKWKVYGFDNRDAAACFLAEDEYTRFDSMDEQDVIDMGVKKSDVQLPVWEVGTSEEFEYLGTY